MRKLGKDKSGLDLKSDFPARESFRKALFERMLAASSQQAERKADARFDDFDPEIRELSDDELEMLAAAQGSIPIPREWLP